MMEFDPKEEAEGNLRKLLRKLGLKSCSYVTGTLTEEDLRSMMQQVQNNFGTPDRVIMSQDMFDALNKLLK